MRNSLPLRMPSSDVVVEYLGRKEDEEDEGMGPPEDHVESSEQRTSIYYDLLNSKCDDGDGQETPRILLIDDRQDKMGDSVWGHVHSNDESL